MSNYNSFVADFPKRCGSLLDAFFEKARMRDREVTLMLAVATAGFVIPFERLRSSQSEDQHPARDRERHEQAALQLDALMKKRFVDSPLCEGFPGSWMYAKEVQDEQLDLDFWPELNNPKPLSKGREVGGMLKHIRNALAHGNIFLHGNPIDLIVLLSKCHGDAEHFSMLAVEPSDFHLFLREWFSFLDSIHMPSGIFEEQAVA